MGIKKEKIENEYENLEIQEDDFLQNLFVINNQFTHQEDDLQIEEVVSIITNYIKTYKIIQYSLLNNSKDRNNDDQYSKQKEKLKQEDPIK